MSYSRKLVLSQVFNVLWDKLQETRLAHGQKDKWPKSRAEVLSVSAKPAPPPWLKLPCAHIHTEPCCPWSWEKTGGRFPTV